jgi:hypothetical protein
MNQPKTQLQTHVEALRAQLGPTATPARLALADRIATLLALAAAQETQFARDGKMTDEKGYHVKIKLIQSGLIALGCILNPRTTSSLTVTGSDGHAALLDD